MPPPKKAGKKTAKKAAKKSAGHHHEDHQPNELRRAFEHMGRLEILRRHVPSPATEPVEELLHLAQQAIAAGHKKDAADLLRASEHLSFAALAQDSPSAVRVSSELEEAIAAKFDSLTRKADEHWQDKREHSKTLSALFESCKKSAAKAFKAGAYHQALEFSRAAKALAHLKENHLSGLDEGKKALRLKGA